MNRTERRPVTKPAAQETNQNGSRLEHYALQNKLTLFGLQLEQYCEGSAQKEWEAFLASVEVNNTIDDPGVLSIFKQAFEGYVYAYSETEKLKIELAGIFDCVETFDSELVGSGVFAANVGNTPHGTVSLEPRGGFFAFIFSDPSDYAALVRVIKQKESPSEDTYGLYLHKAKRIQILDGIYAPLLLVKNDQHTAEQKEKIIRHEEQHFRNDHLYGTNDSIFAAHEEWYNKNLRSQTEPLERTKEEALRYAVIKDELLAYIKDGRSVTSIRHELAQTFYAPLFDAFSEKERISVQQELQRILDALDHYIDVMNRDILIQHMLWIPWDCMANELGDLQEYYRLSQAA